jgi:hypothetical protein
MPKKDFLEKDPLYSKLDMDISPFETYKEIPRPAVHMFCESCESDQTFQMVSNYNWKNRDDFPIPKDLNAFEALCVYECAACGCHRSFLLHFDIQEHSVTKAGQYPPWNIEIRKDLTRVLGKYEKVYKKGLICESQGYGIGAYAYYRRIIEDIIDKLLDMIPELLSGNEREIYQHALELTKQETTASDKIALVKDLLPISLRPGGVNPLNALYQALSEGLHAETDEDCMALAENIRLVLIYLVEQVALARESSKSFTEGMKKLLEKKSNRAKGSS